MFKHNNVTIKYKLDNEFELIFLVRYLHLYVLKLNTFLTP